MNVEVREATPADALAIRDVHLASIEGLGSSAYGAEQVAAWAHDRDPEEYPIDAEDTYFIVAERETIVGFGWLAFESGAHLVSEVDAEVVAVYVHPAVARQGVGSALLAELEAAARERDVETLGLWASLPALCFYLSHGYERVAEHTHEFAPGTKGRVVEMERTFGSSRR
ncbi:GNAT family N-acetyltransferase [Halobacteriales archaeon QH_6_64_20]|jgi:putative acetyltransferase|nr:MAG: GNAT family N-acetyltransferase [Halobacteriales archaeon QH_6_64_20]